MLIEKTQTFDCIKSKVTIYNITSGDAVQAELEVYPEEKTRVVRLKKGTLNPVIEMMKTGEGVFEKAA